jgi:hypothetical protein
VSCVKDRKDVRKACKAAERDSQVLISIIPSHRHIELMCNGSYSQDEIVVVRSSFVRTRTDSKKSPRINPVSRNERGGS